MLLTKAKNVLLIPHAIFFDMWHERNKRVFERRETTPEHIRDYLIKALFFFIFFGWDSVKFCQSSVDVGDFV